MNKQKYLQNYGGEDGVDTRAMGNRSVIGRAGGSRGHRTQTPNGTRRARQWTAFLCGPWDPIHEFWSYIVKNVNCRFLSNYFVYGFAYSPIQLPVVENICACRIGYEGPFQPRAGFWNVKLSVLKDWFAICPPVLHVKQEPQDSDLSSVLDIIQFISNGNPVVNHLLWIESKVCMKKIFQSKFLNFSNHVDM